MTEKTTGQVLRDFQKQHDFHLVSERHEVFHLIASGIAAHGDKAEKLKPFDDVGFRAEELAIIYSDLLRTKEGENFSLDEIKKNVMKIRQAHFKTLDCDTGRVDQADKYNVDYKNIWLPTDKKQFDLRLEEIDTGAYSILKDEEIEFHYNKALELCELIKDRTGKYMHEMSIGEIMENPISVFAIDNISERDKSGCVKNEWTKKVQHGAIMNSRER